MIPTEDIISIVKNTITASIKCNTHRGYIGWSSCDNICMDMHDCLDMCAETLEMRGYMVALEAATYILVSGVKLASHADSSSGMLVINTLLFVLFATCATHKWGFLILCTFVISYSITNLGTIKINAQPTFSAAILITTHMLFCTGGSIYTILTTQV